MNRTKTGNQWHFGMKAHIGVDADSGLTHTLVTIAAKVSDITQAHALLHGDESAAIEDAGYQGAEVRQENETNALTRKVALRPGKHCALPDTRKGRFREQFEKLKASVLAKVEHPFHVVKKILWTQEGALSRIGQEHGATACSLWYCESDDRQALVVRASCPG